MLAARVHIFGRVVLISPWHDIAKIPEPVPASTSTSAPGTAAIRSSLAKYRTGRRRVWSASAGSSDRRVAGINVRQAFLAPAIGICSGQPHRRLLTTNENPSFSLPALAGRAVNAVCVLSFLRVVAWFCLRARRLCLASGPYWLSARPLAVFPAIQLGFGAFEGRYPFDM